MDLRINTKTVSPPPPPIEEASRSCTAPSASGGPCRAWAVRASDPLRCAPADEIGPATHQALDALSEELGIEL